MANQTISAINGLSAFHTIKADSQPNPNGGAIGLTISELTHQGKLNLRCGADMHKKITKIIGMNSNPANNQVTQAGDWFVVWLGPDEVMLLVEAGAEGAIAKQINDAAGKAHMAVNDVTDALVSIKLKGPAVRQVLAKGCALDLHKDHFTKGECAQTIMAHSGITLICVDEDEFILIGRTSFTDYIVAYLADAALEYGYEVKA